MALQRRGSRVQLDERSLLPNLSEVTNFYRDVFQKAKMEKDCIIMTLVYVERLIKVTNGLVRPRAENWRSILFSCMVLSSKVWDDLSMWNADFMCVERVFSLVADDFIRDLFLTRLYHTLTALHSQTCPSGVIFSLKRVNELELAVLSALSYNVKVPASEYAKYYFLLRSMLIKSGLGGDSLLSEKPLDIKGARRLEQLSTAYSGAGRSSRDTSSYRSKSIGDIGHAFKQKVGLEHLVG
jgi:hypothetical protein